MTIEEFNDIVTGRKASSYLQHCPRPSGEKELTEYKRLEAEKHAMRSLVREHFPATRTYQYETSWQYRDFSIAYFYVNELWKLSFPEILSRVKKEPNDELIGR